MLGDADTVLAGLPGYELLDSGEGRKLERIAGRLVDRPCPQAIWPRRRGTADWEAAASYHQRKADGGGRWRHRGGDPGESVFAWCGPRGPGLRCAVRFTPFGHCGIFFEQAPLWRWLQDRLPAGGGRVANLFGYTGVASLAAAAAGAEVYHVDSSKGALDWGRRNAEISGKLPGSVRWLHEDARSFLRLGRKRGHRYDLIVLDPPARGHGTGRRRRVFEFARDLAPLLTDAAALLSGPGAALLLTAHAPGVQRAALANCLHACAAGTVVATADLGIRHADDERVLPAGVAGTLAPG